MNWSRLGVAVLDGLVVAFLLGPTLSPPDPFSQLLVVAATFLAALPAAYRYHSRIHRHGWRRHLVLFAGVFVAQIGWQNAVGGPDGTLLHVLVVLVGTVLGGWLAYFGGLERLRGDPA